MAGRTGYPLEWFVEPVDESFKCGICKQVIRDRTVTPCGHVYCFQCISSWAGLYGVCPERCGEVELHSLSCPGPLDTISQFISGLSVHCQNRPAGCRIQIRLAEKCKHEQICPHRRPRDPTVLGKLLPKFSLSQQDLTRVNSSCSLSQDRNFKILHKRSESASALRIHTAPSSTASVCRPAAMPVAMNSKGSYTAHVFRLKRTKAKEPLGLVLVSGGKTSDGRPVDFHVKKVHKDTLGWRAGLQADDRIVQVDHHDITSISPQEAVARIKEKTLVTLTVHRGVARVERDQHLYDEIFYSDSQLSQQNLSQQDDNMSLNFPTYPRAKGGVTGGQGDENQRSHRKPSSSSVATGSGRRTKPMHQVVHQTNQGTRGSQDSGLSTGSSVHHEHEDGFAGRPEPHRHRIGSQGSQGSHGSQCSGSGRSRIEGNFEVENIYLQKNDTSQLGITLGYDTKSSSGNLIVCEVLPNGLAAQNGHLKNGDIIRTVNGFEVHDPEEAILMFLEQDQDITLTVARPVKVSPGSRRNGSSTHLHPGQATPPYPDGPRNLSPGNPEDHSYALLDDSVQFRRVDSCGALDSHRQPSPVMESSMGYDHPNHFLTSSQTGTGGEKMRRTKSASATSKPPRRRSPPARQPSPLVTDSQQQVYHVLQQPGSPLEPGPSSQPVYHVLQQPGSPQEPARPEYQVLQQSGSPQELVPSSSQPIYEILQQSGSSQEPAQLEYQVLQQPPWSPAPSSSQPEYHVLQQPSSPQDSFSPSSQERVYHVLQQSGNPKHVGNSQAPPTYHVLQQPKEPLPYQNPPMYQPPAYEVLQPDNTPSPSAFQEELKLISQAGKSACRVRRGSKGGLSNNAMNSSLPQLHLHRARTAPQLKHRIIEGEPPSLRRAAPPQPPAESLV